MHSKEQSLLKTIITKSYPKGGLYSSPPPFICIILHIWTGLIPSLVNISRMQNLIELSHRFCWFKRSLQRPRRRRLGSPALYRSYRYNVTKRPYFIPVCRLKMKRKIPFILVVIPVLNIHIPVEALSPALFSIMESIGIDFTEKYINFKWNFLTKEKYSKCYRSLARFVRDIYYSKLGAVSWVQNC